MLKHKIVLVSTLMAIGASATSMAAVITTETSISLKAVVPSTVFYAQPRNPNFGTSQVSLAYDPIAKKLNPLLEPFDVKTTTGSVKAFIVGGPVALYNGTVAQNIPLTTEFNGVTLTNTATEVVDVATAVPGTPANLVITPGDIPAGASGEYLATYSVVFENGDL